jgi:hypothetical protein
MIWGRKKHARLKWISAVEHLPSIPKAMSLIPSPAKKMKNNF